MAKASMGITRTRPLKLAGHIKVTVLWVRLSLPEAFVHRAQFELALEGSNWTRNDQLRRHRDAVRSLRLVIGTGLAGGQSGAVPRLLPGGIKKCQNLTGSGLVRYSGSIPTARSTNVRIQALLPPPACRMLAEASPLLHKTCQWFPPVP